MGKKEIVAKSLLCRTCPMTSMKSSLVHVWYGTEWVWPICMLVRQHDQYTYSLILPPPPPRKKTQRRSWNASIHDATVVTNRQGTGHWHAHCYDNWHEVLRYLWIHPTIIAHIRRCHHPTLLPHLPKTSISGCNYFFIGSGWQPKLQMYLW